MKMTRLFVLGLMTLTLTANTSLAAKHRIGRYRSIASEEIMPAEERYSLLGMVETKSFSVSDKAVGTMGVFQVDDGSAANPVSVYLVIPAPEDQQQGDGEVRDVYKVGGLTNGVKSVKITGNDVVIVAGHNDVDTGKSSSITLKVTFKDASGKRLAKPVLN